MSRTFDISMVGDKALQKKLAKYERKTQAKALRTSMKTAMEPVRQLAVSRVPVLSGRLKKTIKIGTVSKKGKVSAVIRTGTRKQLRIPADARYYYPAAIEYGTRFIPARSFLRSSLFGRQGQVMSIFARELANLLRSIR